MIALCTMRPRVEIAELGFGAGSDIYLTDQRRYTVSAIAIMRGSPWVLVLPDQGRPDWYPSRLFEFVREVLPSHWKFRIRPNDSAYTSAIWGYAEIALQDAHLFGLAEREPAALEQFQKSDEFERAVDELQWHLLGLLDGSISAFEASSWAISALESSVGNALLSDGTRYGVLAELASFDEISSNDRSGHAEAMLASVS